MKYYLTEFIGTLFLTLTVTLAGRSDLAPLAIASVLMILVYAGGYISGAHYNPAVTFALALTRNYPKVSIRGYILAQIAGSVVGALIATGMAGEILAPVPTAPIIFAALIAEIVFTMLLCYTVLHTAAGREPNQYYGLAIGAVLIVAAVIAGPISGAVLNPAIGVGAFITQVLLGAPIHPTATLLYIVGPLTGAVLASAVYGVQKNG
jgi:aquaporin Z